VPTTIAVGDTAATGAAAIAARRDHAHGITSSENPGVAASLLATDASGRLYITGQFAVGQFIDHIGDVDTYLDFQADRLTLTCGGIVMWDAVEGASDYVLFNVDVDMDGSNIILDTDGDTLLHAPADDRECAVQFWRVSARYLGHRGHRQVVVEDARRRREHSSRYPGAGIFRRRGAKWVLLFY
jgi:hypothetical protein